MSFSVQAMEAYTFTKNLTLGSDNEDVRQLQIILNSDPETQIIPKGSGNEGTVGNEITYFGNATKEAVQKFQKKYRILPVSGFVGPATRGVLNYFNKREILGSNPIDLRINGDGVGDNQTVIFDSSTTTKNKFDISWLATSTLSGCKGLSDPTISTWNGDRKPRMGTEVIEIGNQVATTTVSLVCSSSSESVSAEIKIDRTPAFSERTAPATSSVNMTLFIDRNNKVDYSGTTTTHTIFWSTNKNDTCIGRSVPVLNKWNNNSKFTSGLESITLPAGTTTKIYLKCTNPKGFSDSRLVVFNISTSTDTGLIINNKGKDNIKIKTPSTGDIVKINTWTPINFTVKSGFSTTTRLNVRLIGPKGGEVENKLWLGQIGIGSSGKPFNCGMAQVDTDRTILCDETGLKFRVLSATPAGKYQIKFANAASNVEHIDEVWFGPEFNIKDTGSSGSTKNQSVNCSVFANTTWGKKICSTTAKNSLKIVSPTSGANIVKKVATDFKFKILSGFTTGQEMKMRLIKDTGAELDLGSFILGARIIDCVDNQNFATFTCGGGTTIKVKLTNNVAVGDYKLKIINIANEAKEVWSVPIHVVSRSDQSLNPKTNTATASDSGNGFWNFLKRLFK